MTTYTWQVLSMSVLQQVGSNTDYVITATWSIEGQEIIGETIYTGLQYGTTEFNIDPEKTDFIDYNSLTESQVIGWIQSTLGTEGVDKYQAMVDKIIADQQLPPVITLPLPWEQPAVAVSVVAE